MSYGLEAVYGTRFWDYSYTNFHLNGRICLIYTIFWAILSLLLISFVKPIIDKFIAKLDFKHITIIEIGIAIFLIIDIICTVWGLDAYKQRAMNSYYKREVSSNSIILKIENILFSNEKMKKTFPNVRFINENNEEIWIRDLL